MNSSTLQFHQKVNTPNGPGLVQGYEIDTEKIIVSHDPHDPGVAELVKEDFIRGIWILRRYTPEQLTSFVK